MNSQNEMPRRRSRRPLPRKSNSQTMIGLINAVILAIGLTLILASRCDDSPKNQSESGAWLESFITPKDLHLPTSVTDRLIEGGGHHDDDQEKRETELESTSVHPQ